VTTTDTQAVEPAPEQGETLSLLGNDRRLRVVHSLVESDEPTTTRALATRIAEAEAAREGSDATADDLYKSVYVSLQQTHLPKLADHGIVDYDPDANAVRPGPRLDEARVYVRPETEEPARLPPALAVVAGVGLVAVLGARFDLPLVSAVEPTVWAALALLAVLAVVAGRRLARDGA
jgi:hypothetical protein